MQSFRTCGMALVAIAAMLAVPLPAAAQAPVPEYELYRGGAYPLVATAATWTMQDQVYGSFGVGSAITGASLHGTFVGSRVGCTSWRGISSDSGTLTVGSTGKTYTVYDVVVDINVYSATTQTVAGKWLDSDGARGVFAGFGYFDYVVGYDCGIFIDQWGFGPTSADTDAIIAYLQEQVPENRAPNAPELLGPSDGYTFQPDQIQAFSVQATDLDNDNYVGLIFVRRPGANDFEREWPTAPAASGDAATGVAPLPYDPGIDYRWKARASDGRLSSPDSAETRLFSVAG